MLTKSDIEFIKRNRTEITQNRTDSVILFKREVIGVDPFTGDEIYGEVEVPAKCTWLTYTSESPGTDDRRIINGAVAEVGDAFANFDLDVDLSGVNKIKHVPTGEYWIIRGIDLVGIGEPNRQYVLLGKVV